MDILKKLNLKNEQLCEAIEAAMEDDFSNLSSELRKPFIDALPPTEAAMCFVVGYISSLIEVAEYPEVNLKLDLTYETIENLPDAIAYEFMVGMNSGYSLNENIEIAEKTIASYLTFVAMNEHQLAYTVKEGTLDPKNPGKNFTGISVMVNNMLAQCNFLEAAHGCLQYKENEITVLVSDVCKAYKNLTGVDLKEFGLDDLQAEF